MRRFQLTALVVAVLVLPLLLVGGSKKDKAGTGPSDVDVYFRSTEIGELAPQTVVKYEGADPGESKLLGRAFPGAPPQIPHSLEDLLPITTDENSCIDCHLPENLADGGVAIPSSHFDRPLIVAGGPGEGARNKVEGYEKSKELSGRFYACNICHVDQAEGVDTPANRF